MSRLAFALDVKSADEALACANELGDSVDVLKIGLELFVSAGPAVVRDLVAKRACFLDLKLHDIPETMARAATRAADLGATYLTIHASAGRAAIKATRQAVEGSPLKLLAVTVLTSFDVEGLDEVGLLGGPVGAATRLALLAKEAGAHGMVCSVEECAALRAAVGPGMILATPGIRPTGGDAGDQKRVATPASAVAAGADILVVGRPIRDATNRRSAALGIRAEMQRAASKGAAAGR